MHQQRVGDHDVAILAFDRTRGDDAAGGADQLARWLVNYGYAYSESIREWLQPYVKNDWKITAFRMARDAAARDQPKSNRKMTSKPMRLSFRTDRPFYPYREPADQRGAQAAKTSRLLRVFFIADKRFTGQIGNGIHWEAKTAWADSLKRNERKDLLPWAKLTDDSGPKEWFVTEFEDRSTPRPGTDEVYFSPSLDQSTVARQPTILFQEYNLFAVCCCSSPFVFLGGSFLLVRYLIRLRRRRGSRFLSTAFFQDCPEGFDSGRK